MTMTKNLLHLLEKLYRTSMGSLAATALMLIGLSGAGNALADQATIQLQVPFSADWDLTTGPEFPGATGSFSIDGKATRNGLPTALLEADFSGGGNYVGIRHPLAVGNVKSLSVDIQTNTSVLGVLVRDATQEAHYIELPLSGEDGEWQTVSVDFLDPALEIKAASGGNNDGKIDFPINDILFRVGSNANDPQVRAKFGDLRVTPQAGASIRSSWLMTPKAPAGLFLESEPIEFAVSAVVPEFTFSVFDWKGKPVFEGKADSRKSSLFSLQKLPRGYYSIELTVPGISIENRLTFSVVADPASPTVRQNTPYSIDVAAIFIPSVKGEHGFRYFSDISRRLGVGMIRDRIGWDSVEPEKGKINLRSFEEYQDILREFGLKSCVTNHTAPVWAKESADSMLPNDPLAVYQFMKTLAEKFGRQTAFEFWNEQDLVFFTKEPAWDFATMMKAAYLGLKAGDPDQLVLPGGFCFPMDKGYNRTAMSNGLAGYFDVFNIHCYDPLQKYPEMIAQTDQFLESFGIGDRAIWLTENGGRAEGPGRQPTDLPGIAEHSPDQEMLQAEFAVKSQILMQSLGVDRTFTFVLPPYFEGDGAKAWGLVRYDYSGKPALTAFATLTEELGAKRYKGTVELASGVKGFLYEGLDGEQILVFWSESPMDRDPDTKTGLSLEAGENFPVNFELAFANGVKEIDLFGRESKVEPLSGSLHLTAERYPKYLRGLHAVPVAKEAAAPRKEGAGSSDNIDKSIVLQLVSKAGDKVDYDAFQRDVLTVRKALSEGDLIVRVWNLSDVKKRGTIQVTGEESSALIEVPAFESRDISIGALPDSTTLSSTLSVGGTFDGIRISPLFVPIYRRDLQVPGEAKYLEDTASPEGWKKNSSAESLQISQGEEKGAVRFEADFLPGIDRWIYPEYELKLPDESLEGAISLEFEIKSEQVSTTHVVMFDNEGDGDIQKQLVGYEYTVGEWSKCSVDIPLHSIKAKKIKIGLNPDTLHAAYQLRNVKIRYAQKKEAEPQ